MICDHSKTLVPLETWCYYSPEVKHNNKIVDIGLFAEALIYYDNLFVNVSTPAQMASFISWFTKQNATNELISLLDNGILRVYYYAFHTAPIQADGSWSIWNVQDEEQSKKYTFEERILYHTLVSQCFPHARNRDRLYKAFRQNVIEVKADSFGPAVDNARLDYLNPERCALLVQALVDYVYPLFGGGDPPKVECQIMKDGAKHRITWNVNFDNIARLLGKEVKFSISSPFAAAAICNKLIWSSADLECDLYVASPMSTLIGNKMYESNYRILGPEQIIDELKTEVEFPDIRTLINNGTLDLNDVIKIRGKANRFREWLQESSERDENAIIAYHKEVAEDLGLLKFGKKALRLFGILGTKLTSEFIKSYLSHELGPVESSALGSALNTGTEYLNGIIQKFTAGWRPVVFGDWLSFYIKHMSLEQDKTNILNNGVRLK